MLTSSIATQLQTNGFTSATMTQAVRGLTPDTMVCKAHGVKSPGVHNRPDVQAWPAQEGDARGDAPTAPTAPTAPAASTGTTPTKP
ncbi:MAG TPA: hypothetical protein VIY73_12185 [Polyangiaceae bacterium]